MAAAVAAAAAATGAGLRLYIACRIRISGTAETTQQITTRIESPLRDSRPKKTCSRSSRAKKPEVGGSPMTWQVSTMAAKAAKAKKNENRAEAADGKAAHEIQLQPGEAQSPVVSAGRDGEPPHG